MLEREFQRKRKIRSRIYSKTTAAILFVVAILLVGPTWRVYKTKVESGKKFEHAAAELEALREKEQNLKENIGRIGTEKGTEEEIRKKFNVAKEGEVAVLFVETEESPAPPSEERGFFGRMWEGFTGMFKD